MFSGELNNGHEALFIFVFRHVHDFVIQFSTGKYYYLRTKQSQSNFQSRFVCNSLGFGHLKIRNLRDDVDALVCP